MSSLITILKKINPTFIELLPLIESNIDSLNQKYTSKPKELFSEKDCVLITYPDQFKKEGEKPLKTLDRFLQDDLQGKISHVHILPFYPWTSDDGFAPVCYQKVEDSYGDWNDISHLSSKKMVDCVFNHVSSKNEFFLGAREGKKCFEDMFHVFDKEKFADASFREELKKVVRPRTSELLTPFDFEKDTKYVWTTFGEDQVDTNLSNKDMMNYVLNSLFLYIENGARYFRIDAVPFLWKELGTSCSHHEKTHLIVKLIRAIFDEINLDLLLITESNVPHHENISYWGNGEDEAHLIYNFSLAPLILHALSFGSSRVIQSWSGNVFDLNKKTSFLNFTASHDGIGVRGLEGLVPESQVLKMCAQSVEKNGQIGQKKSRSGKISPYELNCTWASFLKDEDESDELWLQKVVNSHALVMFYPGVPAHYVHNFLLSENWQEGYEESSIARRLNRKKLKYPLTLNVLQKKAKNQLLKLIDLRANNNNFHPNAEFKPIDLHDKIISFERGGSTRVMFNLSNERIALSDQTLEPYELRIV